MNDITIQHWDESKFDNCRAEWTALLAKSNADPLFLSWEWQHTWWKVFARDDMHLCLYAAVDKNNNLIGLAPLYISTHETARYLKTRRLEFVGNCWRHRGTMRTEFVEFITEKKNSADIIKAFLCHIQNALEWDEFVIANLCQHTETYHALQQEKLLPECYLRTAEKYPSHYLKTDSAFSDYLRNLGKHTRLKMYNRRKTVAALGSLSFQIRYDNLDDLFTLLNKLHQARWGNPVFEKDRLEFNKRLAAYFTKNKNVYFSILSLNEHPFSIQYNYIINGHVYNLQSGFDTSAGKKISPGYLHFGYEIEHAFNSNTTIYDLLAGEGKNIAYKRHLTSLTNNMMDLQLISHRGLKLLYRAYDVLKGRV